jgi:hypothetical protein
MFSALDYDHTSGPSGNYRRSGSTPLLGIQGNEIASIPFFASPRINTATASLTTQADDAATNTQTIGGAAAEQVAYFGCWLDINLDASDPHGLQFPTDPTADAGGRDGPYSGTRQTIQNLIRGHHQCLVAEVFFQPAGTDPIPTGATPASSDRLAQRNLAIVESGNPGWPETHTIQHTFQLKASSVTTRQVRTQGEHPAAQDANRKAALFEATGDRAIGPDELMIQWNNVPRDSVATFYLPEIDVDEILELADLRQHPAVLEKIDAHTLRSRIADRTFIPLPGNRPGYLAGLISLTLPAGITTGQVYKLSLQQYSGINHKVLGAFQITIPVRTDPEILPNEIRKLSVLRSIQQTIPTGSRWHSIFIRYLDQIAERVRGLGGDPDAVRPSPDGGDRGDTKPCLPSKPVRIDPDDLISLNIPWSECEIEGELELKLRFRRRCE